MEYTTAPVDHLVWFYEERAHLVANVAEYAADGLRRGDSVLLVATADHLADIQQELLLDGVDTANLEVIDAAALLDRFYRHGIVDGHAFETTVGELVRHKAQQRNLRVFGEMVALLWADGDVQGAVQLEALWCRLRENVSFELLCAYPSSVMFDDALHAPVNAVCELHSEIRLGDAGEPATALRVYPATPQAVGEARRFVRACLGGSGRAIEDIMLVTSELASNAVRHAQSPFAVEVTLLDGAVRIAVRDGSARSARLVPMTGTAESGRGIATVAAIANRWAIDTHAFGKTVWAELPL